METPSKHSILSESTTSEILLCHPSALSDIKHEVSKQLKRRLGQWNPEQQGVLISYKGRKQILNGGRGRIVDTSPYVHLAVKYTGVYARPYVGAKIFGKVLSVAVSDDKVTLVCSIEAELTAIVNNIDKERYVLKSSGEQKKADSSDDSDLNDDDDDGDNDSIFGDEEKAKSSAVWHLEDSKKGNRRLEAGSKVKLQITAVEVSEGTIISYATLL